MGGGESPVSRIQVAAGVLTDSQGRVLIAQRAQHGHQGGAWEFPGGKVAPRESPREALDRELQEELGIRVQSARKLLTLEHDYPDRAVCLHFFRVQQWYGEPVGREGQPLSWLLPAELMDAGLLPADQPVVNKLMEERAD